MFTKQSESVEQGVFEYAKIAAYWLNQRFENPAAFEERIRAGLSFPIPDPQVDHKVHLATNSLGLFSAEIFQAMLSGGEAFKPLHISIVWDRMVAAGLISKIFVNLTGSPFVDHQMDEQELLTHLRDHTFLNLFRLPAHLLHTYSHAVAAVDVVKGDDPARGTAFVVNNKGRRVLVTCRHNVDPAAGVKNVSIISAAGYPLTVGEMVMSDDYDIAIAPLECQLEGPSFVLSSDGDVFEEVFTLGYPRVPRAEAKLVGHRGEINGRAHLYVENCPILLISNLVSPGNSGGPVLLRSGRCVGMITSWLEEKTLVAGQRDGANQSNEFERMRFSAAIPADHLQKVIDNLLEKLS
jgi:hypothetical protein